MDQIWDAEPGGLGDFSGQFLPPAWLEDRIFVVLNDTTSSTTDRLTALEAELQSITSIAYSLMSQALRTEQNTTRPSSTVMLDGTQQLPMAHLQLNGLLLIAGLLCVMTLIACVLISAESVRGSEDPYLLSGDVLDLMCLLRNSILPSVLSEMESSEFESDLRREKAETINVTYVSSCLCG